MTISILAQGVFNLTPGGAASYTVSTFAVPGGTDILLVLPIMRAEVSVTASISSITHNGAALTSAFNNYGAGSFDINSMIGYLRAPDVGTFNIVINCANVGGGAAWVLALAGVKSSGSPVGNTAAQRNSASTATTAGLGLTPTGGSLLLASLASGNNTGTVSDFTGAGFVEAQTGRYSANGDMPATFRYLLNATAAATTAQATFSVASNNCGGLLAEILAEAIGVDVAGTIDFKLAMSGSISSTASASGARLTDASFYNGQAAFTEIWIVEADVTNTNRRLLAVGPSNAPNYTVEQVATGQFATSCWRWQMRLSDGQQSVETRSGSQTTTPTVLALAHGAAGPTSYVNGSLSMFSPSSGPSGALDVGTGGLAIAVQEEGSPAPYSGKIARMIRRSETMSAEQISLLSRSILDPGSIWGYGVEDDAQVRNQSPIVMPMEVRPDGRPIVTITPPTLDPNGTPPQIASVTQPANATVSIVNDSDLQIVLTRGWTGTDRFTVTVNDGAKSSTAQITIIQNRPALKAVGDSIVVAESSSVTFDPRVNDIGAGTLRTTNASNGSSGTTQILSDGRITFAAGSVSGQTADSFSYTVSDDWGPQSASVAVTIDDTGTSFVNTSADTFDTTTGQSVLCNVLANDQASSDNLPLAVTTGSVTTPSPSGTAVLQTGTMEILYTPASGFTGNATFNYTAKPQSKAAPISTPPALVTVRVQTVASSGLPRLQTVPAVGRWHCVGFDPTGRKATYPSGRAGLAAAVGASNLVAGDVIVLETGVYSGAAITCAASGASGNHIMVRSRIHGGASINVQLEVPGAYWWFTGVKFTWNGGTSDIGTGGSGDTGFTGQAQSVHCRNAGLWITNSLFTGYAFIRIYPDNKITNLRFCYNTVNSTIPGIIAHDTGIFVLCHETTQGDRAPPDTEIAWNKVTLPTKASNNDRSRPIIQIQPSHAKSNDMANFCTQSFRFHHNHCVGAWAEAFYCKRNICIEFNYIEWSNNSTARHMVTFRHGILSNNGKYDIGGIIRGNRFHRTAERLAILISGTGISVTSNVHEGGGYGEVWVCSGNGLGNFDFPGGVPRDGADYAQVVDNVGFNTVIVGGEPGASNVGAETAGGRNGWPDHVRIFRGDRGWDPAITRPSDGGEQAPAPAIADGFGVGNAAKVTTITAAALLNAVPPVGCDPM